MVSSVQFGLGLDNIHFCDQMTTICQLLITTVIQTKGLFKNKLSLGFDEMNVFDQMTAFD